MAITKTSVLHLAFKIRFIDLIQTRVLSELLLMALFIQMVRTLSRFCLHWFCISRLTTRFKGFTFSPDGKYAYVTDTGISYGFYGYNLTDPSSMYVSWVLVLPAVFSWNVANIRSGSYRYDVAEDGTLENRKTFAFINSGAPDGKDSFVYWTNNHISLLANHSLLSQVFTAILGATSMLAVVMASRFGTHLASSLVRSTWGRLRPISILLVKGEWSFVLRIRSTMRLWPLVEAMWTARCRLRRSVYDISRPYWASIT